MAKIYKVALTYNNTSGLEAVVPQPASLGCQYPEYPIFGNSKQGTIGNKFTIWRWNSISKADFIALLQQLGLLLPETQSVEVTIFTKNDLIYFRKFNGILQRPNAGIDYKEQGKFITDLSITINDLEQI